MSRKNTDEEWEKWGENDPYYGVITNEKFRNRNLSKELKIEFFDSGRSHVNNIIEVSRRFLDKDFAPVKVLDFGCGVGRLVIPFSEIAERVVGLDVSDSMLNEALNNCNEYSRNNVLLIKSDDNLTSLNGYFDLIHSFIVFQHIPVERGMNIFTNLLNHLDEGGICAIQFIYSHSILGKSYRLPPIEQTNNTVIKKITGYIRKIKRKVFALFKAIPSSNISKDPDMQMNLYNLDEVFSLIQLQGITNIHVEFTDHQGVLGCFLYFQKLRKSKA